MDRRSAALRGFDACFAGQRPFAFVRSPGRVNLIGEHVDYNDGLVLPIAIEPATCAVVGHAPDGRIRVFSASEDAMLDFDVSGLPRHVSPHWDGYVRGVAAELVDRGIPLAGAHIWIGGDLAVGAGLSSSASLELAVAHALLAASGHSIGGSGSELADICRMAEHRYAGVPCGIMDQLVCATAVADAALLIDCRDRSSRAIGWLDADVTAVVVDSGSRHRLSGGTYAQRVAECRAALDHYHVRDPSIRSLRDLTEEALISMRGDLDDTLFRRARHVVSEIQRTSSAAEALAAGEFSSLGRLLNASHESLRVDYEVSSGQLDDLAACVRSVTGVYGARLTGAGFGGCVVALAERGSLEALDATVRNEYARRYGVDARVIPTRACAGASVEIL